MMRAAHLVEQGCKWPCGVRSMQARAVLEQVVPQPHKQRAAPRQIFKFRHFDLSHGKCAMKMGTDAMLLGAWSQPPTHAAAVLDAGTGTGVLALMMAQKTQQQQSIVHAIDVDADSVVQATENACASPWADRLLVAHCSLQEWARQCQRQYDIIISNPPYFRQSSKPGQEARASARHADVQLPFDELAEAASRLLTAHGRLCLILPAVEAQHFAIEAQKQGLMMTRLMKVFTKCADPQPKRHLMQFEKLESILQTATAAAAVDSGRDQFPSLHVEHLVIMEELKQATGKPVRVYSQQYQQLTVDFHHPELFQASYNSSG